MENTVALQFCKVYMWGGGGVSSQYIYFYIEEKLGEAILKIILVKETNL